MESIPVRVTCRLLVNGRPELRNHEIDLTLDIPNEAVKSEGSVKWRFDVKFAGGLDRHEAVKEFVRHAEGRPQAVIERPMTTVSFAPAKAAA